MDYRSMNSEHVSRNCDMTKCSRHSLGDGKSIIHLETNWGKIELGHNLHHLKERRIDEFRHPLDGGQNKIFNSHFETTIILRSCPLFLSHRLAGKLWMLLGRISGLPV